MINALVTAIVVVATAIQTWSGAVELGRANRDAARWLGAEDELVAGERLLRRRAARRLLKSERGEEMHQEIRRIKLTLTSWVALCGAATYAFANAILTVA